MSEQKPEQLLSDAGIALDDEDAQKDKYLTFNLGDEVYGLEIRHITEIIGIQHITVIPNMPEFVKGVINLRGKVIPVMDMRLRFNLEAREYDDRTCIVVTNIKNTSIGLVVDTVREVANIPESEVEPPPAINRGSAGEFILGLGKMGDTVAILLNIMKLLYEDELNAISTEAQTAVA